MDNKFSLLGRKEYQLTDNIIVHIPLVSEIRASPKTEQEYYKLLSIFIKTPCDAMVELDDMGLDYTQVKEYDLFIMMVCGILYNPQSVSKDIWKLIFPYINLEDLSIKPIEDKMIVVDKQDKVIIDEKKYFLLADLLRQIVSTKKNMEYYKVPELETRKYIVSRQRLKQQRALEREAKYGKNSSSVWDGVILLLVNNANFKYNFETVGQITIHDLHACLRQICSDREIDGLMSGYWAGNVDLKKIDSSKLNRIII